MGFGLHAGMAIQGAIGSDRKLDPTYISTAVNTAEKLECLTKEYGVQMLLSGAFHDLLPRSSQRRCRRIERINTQIHDSGGKTSIGSHKEKTSTAKESPHPDNLSLTSVKTTETDQFVVSHGGTQETLELYTFDIIVEDMSAGGDESVLENYSVDEPQARRRMGMSLPIVSRRTLMASSRRWSDTDAHRKSLKLSPLDSSGHTPRDFSKRSKDSINTTTSNTTPPPREKPHIINLPSGPIPYDSSSWLKPDLRGVRRKFSDGRLSRLFNTATEAFQKGDFCVARKVFERILEHFDDGPSRYYLQKMNVMEKIEKEEKEGGDSMDG